MTWSIRARLTVWYSAVVVIVLLTGTVVVDIRQEREMLQRLDDELGRLMFTLQGVMRTEFGEGLDLQASADEASIEVLAPQRSLMLIAPDGRVLARWGEAVDPRWLPAVSGGPVATTEIGSARMRVRSERVLYEGHGYVAVVMAPLAELDQSSASLRRTLAIGIVVALIVAAFGGWLVGRQTLRPLDDMASQATAITDSRLGDRLRAAHPHDELGRLAAAFNGLLDRLVDALHAQRQFMADASHELRTPVSIVRTTAQVTLEKEERTAADYREMMEIVSEQASRLTRLVDAMFLLSRAEANGLPLTLEPLYVDDVVRDAVRGVQVIANQRLVSLSTVGPSGVRFTGDRGLLERMVTNLLDNAARHAKEGGAVTVSIGEARNVITIRVIDDGPGVPESSRERIFHRFVRLSADYNGAGLGLPIARWIAEAHGGHIILEATGPAGSTFVASLARADETDALHT